MKSKQIQKKVGLLNPGQIFIRSNGTKWKMLSDNDGSTRSKHLITEKISYPPFNEMVLINADED